MKLILTFLFLTPAFAGPGDREMEIILYEDRTSKSSDEEWIELLKDTIEKAESGDANSQAILGGLQLYGAPGVEKDTVSALSLLNSSADQGNENAMFVLFQAFSRGLAVEKNEKTALSWLHKSAEGSNRDAQFLLGLKYADGDNVNEDKEKAVMWHTKAAKQGQADAQYMIGINYYSGYGPLPVNDIEAFSWLFVASQNPKTTNKQDVLNSLENTKANLNVDELSIAQEKAEQYLSLYLEPFL